MKTSLKYWLLVFSIALIHSTFAKLDIHDTLPKYDFVRYDLNKISVKDSSSLGPFFEKIWEFESTGKGKARILQIGDSQTMQGMHSQKTPCLR